MDLNTAIGYGQKFLTFHPEQAGERQQLARFYLELGGHVWAVAAPWANPDASLGDYDQAIAFLQKSILLRDEAEIIEKIDTYYKIAEILQYQAKWDQVRICVTKALELQEHLIQKHQLSDIGFRFLQTRTGTLTQIGHLANEPDTFLKTGVLGWRPPFAGILLAPRIMNPCLLDYVAQHLCVITDPKLSEILKPLARILEYNSFWFRLPNGRIEHLHNAMIAVEKQWETEGRQPLFKLTDMHRAKGWDTLKRAGMSEGDWFVPFHVREAASHGDKAPCIRNADVYTYIPAIEKVVERGGWVVRMGDNKMRPLPKMHRVIDYALSDFKSDWMDVFLCAECRFYVGTCSGVSGVASCFGAPAIWTNAIPTDSRPVSKRDLFIPKLFRSRVRGRMISFSEALTYPFRQAYNWKFFQTEGIEIIDNSSDEIVEVVTEMIDRLNSHVQYTGEDEVIQNHFNSMATQHESYGVSSRIGRDFLRRHRHLLEV